MNNNINQNKILFFRVFVLFFIASTMYGIYNHYSPVPFWDMWDGYLDFYVQVNNGNWNKWFAQHNEHRTIFSNILFYIDLHYFYGLNIFLMFCNIFLMSSIAYILALVIIDLFQTKEKEILVYFVIILSFSWIQHENITWGFQSQFFSAYLFPLISFYLIVKAHQQNNNKKFVLSLIFGVLSAGTMANGIMVLPILLVLSLFLKNNILKTVLIFLVTVIVIYLYFKGYHSPSGHGSLKTTLLEHPKDFFKYLFAYLGGLFYYISGKGSVLLSQLAGIFLLLFSIYFTYLLIIKKSVTKSYFISLAFLLYYGGTAFGTAGGRSLFGIEQAFTSRYMTPSIIAWSLVFILLLHHFQKYIQIKKIISIFLIVIVLILSVFQKKAFENTVNDLLDKKVASLALELSIYDEASTNKIFPNYKWLVKLSKEAISQNLSIFGNDLICDLSLKMGNNFKTIANDYLIGSLDSIEFIDNEKKYLKVRGWLFNDELNQVPKYAYIVDKNNTIIGYVISGFERIDVADSISKDAKYSGFYGYVLKKLEGNDFYLINDKLNKKLKIDIKIPIIKYQKITTNNYSNIILKEEIISSTFEKNKIYKNRELKGFEIYGSYIDGDLSKASIQIELNNNRKLLYKTGPRSNGQLINIYQNGNIIYSQKLPISREWSFIRLNKIKKNIKLEIVDNSSEWGEWSAIALRSENEPK